MQYPVGGCFEKMQKNLNNLLNLPNLRVRPPGPWFRIFPRIPSDSNMLKLAGGSTCSVWHNESPIHGVGGELGEVQVSWGRRLQGQFLRKRRTAKVASHVLVCLAFLSAFVFADLGTLSKGRDLGTPFRKRDGMYCNVYCTPRYTCQHQTSVKASKAACGAFDFSPLWRYWRHPLNPFSITSNTSEPVLPLLQPGAHYPNQ